jgi:hypothetical protein
VTYQKPEDEAVREPGELYVRPVLVLVGNLNNLLASGGTKDTDDNMSASCGTGLIANPPFCN